MWQDDRKEGKEKENEVMKLSGCINELIDALNKGNTIIEDSTGKVCSIKTPVAPNTTRTYRRIYNDMLRVVGDREIKDFGIAECVKVINMDKYTEKDTVIVAVNRLLKVQEVLGRITSNPMEDYKKSIQAGGREAEADTYYISEGDLNILVKHTIDSKAIYLGTFIQGCMGLRSAEVHGNEFDYTLVEIDGMVRRQRDKLILGITLEDAVRIINDGKLALKGKGEKMRTAIFMDFYLQKGLADDCMSYIGDVIKVREGEIKNRDMAKQKAVERAKSKESLSEILEEYRPDDRLVNTNTATYNEWLKVKQQQLGIRILSKSGAPSKDKNLTSHVLRHTFAMLWVSHGGSLEVLKELMGHSSIAVTQIYAVAKEDRVEAEVSRLQKGGDS